MATRVFVCHAKSDIEATSEIIDLLESTLELPSDSLASSSLPGYSSDARSGIELREMLSRAAIVFALVTERSAVDTTFAFELGAAWGLGVRVVPLIIDNTEESALPWPLRGAAVIRTNDRAAWVSFVQDLAAFLGVRMRVASDARIAFDEVAARTSLSPAPAVPPPMSVAPERRPSASETSEIVSIIPMQAALAAAGTQSNAISCEKAFEAGRAISDCVWNRDEGLDFARELEEPFGRFIDAMGGSWHDLRKLQDFDVWLGTTDNLLQSLPEDRRTLAYWYELGYELATLHNMASGEEPRTEEERVALEQQWRETLDQLLAQAEAVHIGYEELGRVLPLLENLMAPSSERDFTNISRSLEALRHHAAQADRMTSAA